MDFSLLLKIAIAVTLSSKISSYLYFPIYFIFKVKIASISPRTTMDIIF